ACWPHWPCCPSGSPSAGSWRTGSSRCCAHPVERSRPPTEARRERKGEVKGAAGVRRNNLRRWRRVQAVLSAAVLWAGLSAPGLADLRIVTDEGGMRHELLLKRGQLATSRGGDFRFVVDCDAGVVTVISSPEKKTYWRGSGDELARQVG